jgi:hypothetical protein
MIGCVLLLLPLSLCVSVIFILGRMFIWAFRNILAWWIKAHEHLDILARPARGRVEAQPQPSNKSKARENPP